MGNYKIKRTQDKPVFVFDVCGERIATFKNYYHFKRSKLSEKWQLHNARFSSNTDQHCIAGKFFISYMKNFIVSYTAKNTNHNPLRINKPLRSNAYAHDINESIVINQSSYRICYRILSMGWEYVDGKYTRKIKKIPEYVLETTKEDLRRTYCIDLDYMHDFFLKVNNEMDEFDETVTFYGNPHIPLL